MSQFILDASDHMEDAYHYSIRGQNEMSLGTLTMLSDEMYAAFLIGAQLVSLINKKGGGYKVTSSFSRWDAWLNASDLSYKYGEGQNVAEMSHQHTVGCLQAS
jgi:hypothetical protein